MKFGIKNVDKESKKNSLFNLKMRRFAMKSLVGLKLVWPYLLSTGLVFGISSGAGATPFIIDKTKVPKQLERVFDSNGNDKTISTYMYDSEKTNGIITHYSAWNKTDDNEYERTVKKYAIKDVDVAKIEEYIQNLNTIDFLEDIFGKPINESTETKSSVTSEELNSGDVLEATIYSIDKDNSIVKVESSKNNLTSTIFAILFAILMTRVPGSLRRDFGKYNYNKGKSEIEKINNEYEEAVMLLKNKQGK